MEKKYGKEIWEGTVYPEFVRSLPHADIPVEGVRGWLMEDGVRQIVFFDIQPTAVVPPHKHCAQWGLMIDGEMDLTIDGVTRRYKKGDWYFIPEETMHGATFRTRVMVMDIFDSRDRYKRKK